MARPEPDQAPGEQIHDLPAARSGRHAGGRERMAAAQGGVLSGGFGLTACPSTLVFLRGEPMLSRILGIVVQEWLGRCSLRQITGIRADSDLTLDPEQA